MILKDAYYGRKVMTNLDSTLKSKDITLPTKGCLAKAMVFPVVMYGCESWTVQKAEHWRIDVFELWCWRRLLRVPWTARRSNQSILKEISPGYSLEGMMLKLKLQYFGHLMRRVDSLENTLMLGEIWGRRKRGRQRMKWLYGITDSMNVSFSELQDFGSLWWTGRPGVLHFIGSQRVGHDWVTELNWTDWNCNSGRFLIFWSSYIVKYLFLHLMSIFFFQSPIFLVMYFGLCPGHDRCVCVCVCVCVFLSVCVYIWECLRLLQKNRNLTGGIMIVFRKLQIH